MVNTDPKQRHDEAYTSVEIAEYVRALGPQWRDILAARRGGGSTPAFRNLGKQTPHVLIGADAKLLEAVPFDGKDITIVIDGDEFTSLCPATGGPDFGKITVVYAPRGLIVESKSFKYYMESFRNEPIFHERVVAKIRDDLVSLLSPASLSVHGEFKPRGGWSINPLATYLRPKDVTKGCDY